MKNRTLFVALSLILLYGFSSLLAQDQIVNADTSGEHDPHHKGAIGLKLQPFWGSIMVAGKYHTSENRAIQLSIGFDWLYSEQEQNYYGPAHSRSSSENLDFKIGMQYIFYVFNHSNVHPFIGVGPGINVLLNHSRMLYNPDYYSTSQDDDWTQITPCLNADVGIEFIISDWISFIANYRIYFEYEKRIYKAINRNTLSNSESTYEMYSFESEMMALQLVFYLR
ncbi:hypothetical protein K9N50_04415 [bacterium]|nr:hypothetical protein [bacterium]